MKKNELTAIINEIVEERVKITVKQYLKHYIPMMIGEAVSDMIDDKLQMLTSAPKPKGNKLNELFNPDNIDEGDSEFRTIGNRTLTASDRPKIANKSKIAAMLGYGDVGGTENTITTVVTESGVEVPVDPSLIPDHITNALNKNYSTFLQKMKVKSNG